MPSSGLPPAFTEAAWIALPMAGEAKDGGSSLAKNTSSTAPLGLV